LSNDSSSVELIKSFTDVPVSVRRKTRNFSVNVKSIDAVSSRLNYGRNNTVRDPHNITVGDRIVVNSNSEGNAIFGESNMINVNSNNNLNSGSGNTIYGSNNAIIGGLNHTLYGERNAIIGGSENDITGSSYSVSIINSNSSKIGFDNQFVFSGDLHSHITSSQNAGLYNSTFSKIENSFQSVISAVTTSAITFFNSTFNAFLQKKITAFFLSCGR
jgi:hypothetical protein